MLGLPIFLLMIGAVFFFVFICGFVAINSFVFGCILAKLAQNNQREHPDKKATIVLQWVGCVILLLLSMVSTAATIVSVFRVASFFF